jgi:hypothetical protein
MRRLSTAPDKSITALLLPEEFEVLAARVKYKIRRVQSFAHRATLINLVAVIGGGVLWAGNAPISFLWFLCPSVFVMLLTFCNKYATIRSLDKDAQRLLKFVKHTGETTHLRTVLDLWNPDESLSGIWLSVSREADAAIMRLLPLIQPVHAEIFTTPHRYRLRHSLFHHNITVDLGVWRSNEHCLLVLSALEQIGDRRDLPDIQRLMKEPYISAEVRTAAQRCAQIITERIAREDHRDFLLRPDIKPEAVDTLLRPSEERTNTSPRELLRATSTDDADPPV